MPKFLILHAIEPHFFGEIQLPVAEKYAAIAIVEATDIEHVYCVSNHIESNWTENPEVQELFSDRNRTRSTSVGDLVIDANENVQLCAAVGWEEVDSKEVDIESFRDEIRMMQPYRCPRCHGRLEVSIHSEYDIDPVTGLKNTPSVETTFRCTSCDWNSEDFKDPIIGEMIQINQ